MSWKTPIINWIASNVLTSADMNRIEGNTQYLADNKVDKVAGKGLSTNDYTTTEKNALANKVDNVVGKGLSTNDYTTTEKNKLAGIASGAQVNTVTSVAGKTGAVTLEPTNVGLGSVANYAVATKAEAEAGTSNTKYMTPLRVKEYTAWRVGNFVEPVPASFSVYLATPSWTSAVRGIMFNWFGTIRVRYIFGANGAPSSGDSASVQIYKNGVAVGPIHTSTVNYSQSPVFIDDIQVEKGDVLKFYFRKDGGTIAEWIAQEVAILTDGEKSFTLVE